MNTWWVLYQGELRKIPVFNEKSSYRNQVKYPTQGTKAYVVINHVELEVCYDEEYQVFHVEGVKPQHSRELLATREDVPAHR